MGCCLSEPNNPKEEKAAIPITHCFTLKDEQSCIAGICDQTRLLPAHAQFVVEYAAIRPGETPDAQMMTHLAMLTLDLSRVSTDHRIFEVAHPVENGIYLSRDYPFAFIATDQPRMTCVRVSDYGPSWFILPETSEDYRTVFKTTDGFKCKKQHRRPNTTYAQVAYVPHPFSCEGFNHWDIYLQTDTFALFYNLAGGYLWASPWCFESDVSADRKKGFLVTVHRDGKTILFPQRPLYEVEPGRFIQVISNADGGASMEVFEYKFDTHPTRFCFLNQRTLTPSEDTSILSLDVPYHTHIRIVSTTRNSGNLVFVDVRYIGVMFFTANAWSLRWYPRSDFTLRSTSPVVSEHTCGEWHVVLHQSSAGHVSLTRISLDTRYLTAPT